MLGMVKKALNYETQSNTLSHQNMHHDTRSPNQSLLVENADKMKFTNSINIEKEIAGHFPHRKLLHAFRKSRGQIHLEYGSQEEATEISDA